MVVISYLITVLSILFVIVRGIVAFCYSAGIDIEIDPINPTIEIILLFVAIFCIFLIIRRNIWGALLYFITYGLYFGNNLYEGIIRIKSGEAIFNASIYLYLLGVVIPFLTLVDILFNKGRKGNKDDPKTDWFFKNKKYDRKLDKRADDNQYKF